MAGGLLRLVGFEPGLAGAGLYFDGNAEGEGVAHGVGDEEFGGVDFVFGDFEEEFVVDLEEHAGAEAGLVDFLIDSDHCEFDHVSGGALDGCVHGDALGAAADGGVGGGDVANVAAAAGEGFDVALFFGGGDDVVDVALDAGELFEVGVDDLTGLLAGDAEALGEAEGGDAVDDAEVDHFGGAAHVGGDVGEGDAVDAGGGCLVDVVAVLEGVDHGFVAADGGHDAELDLGVVGAEEEPAGTTGDEGFADLATVGGADGDVLEIGIAGGEAAGGGEELVKVGVNATGDG